VLLLDEPFSALDRANRERLHLDVLSLQAESQLVVLYVTHNLEDAFAIGHQLAIVYEGKIEQFGTPETIFRQPANLNVARTLGMTNLFQARVVSLTASSVQLDWLGVILDATPSSQVETGANVTAYIRPEEVQILSENPSRETDSLNCLSGTVIRKQAGYQFHTLRVRLRNEQEIEIAAPASQPLDALPNGEIHLALPKLKLHVLP
jgi:molybdate transport system ATP-binding protein